jgi:hypothetical protein
MPTYARQRIAVLGAGRSGLAGTLGYTVLSTAGATLVARTTAGVVERGSSGTYIATVTEDTSWSGRIEWDAPGMDPVVEEVIPVDVFKADVSGLATTVQLASAIAGLSTFDPEADAVTLAPGQLGDFPTAADILDAFRAHTPAFRDVTNVSVPTLEDCWAAAFVEAAGAESVAGLAYTKSRPGGGTFRSFTLDDDEAPTSRS